MTASALLALLAGAVVVAAWRFGPPRRAPIFRPPALGKLGWLGVGLVFGLGLACVFAGHWWDEYSCHFPVAASLSRGVVPAEHPLFPGEPFRYHYGFDLLAAWVRALSGASVDVALDLVSAGCLALLLWLARDLGATLGGRRGARLTPVVLLLGSGTLLFLLYRDAGPLEVHWDALPRRWLDSVPPPTISNFFQHPQGLGMPLALAVLLVFDRPLDDPLRTRRSALGAFLMAALSLAQIVFFGTLGLVLGVVTLLMAWRAERRRQVLIDGALLLGSLGGGFLLGGFFAPGPPAQSMLLFGTSYFRDPAGAVLAYHLVVFGLPLLALPAGVVLAWRRPHPVRTAVVVAAGFGFAVPHFVTYERSWDIVKFLGIGGFFANAILADVLARWPRRPPLRRAAVPVLVLLATLSGWVFVLRMGVLDGRFGIPPMHFPPPSPVGEAVTERLEPLVAQEDYVFSTNVDVARAGGLLTPGFDWRQVGQGFMLDRPRSLRLAGLKARARRSLDPEALAGLGVRWMVLSPGDRDALNPAGQARLRDPQRFDPLGEVRAGGQLRYLYRVLPGAYEP